MKKYAAYAVGFLDILLHSTLLFSWPILTQIYKSEGFFSCQNSNSSFSESCSESSQDASIARIMILAVSILGPFTFILGLARDYLAFGWCRAICFCVLIFSYVMLAFAEPGKSDWMLYFWILQFGSGTTLMISYFHLAKLFPLHQALLIGFFNVSSDVSSLIPQLWDTLLKTSSISLKSINLVWALLSLISFIFGTFILPWHNVEVQTKSVETVFDLKTKKKSLLNSNEESVFQQFKNNLKFLKSPILVFYGSSLIFGNFAVTCTLSLTNFIVEKKISKLNLTEIYDPEEIVSKFNLIRPIIAAIAAPVIGVMVDFVRKHILKKSNLPDHIDLRSMILPYFLMTFSSLIFALTISIDNFFCLAIALTCLSLNSTWVYVVYTTGMEINLPGQTIGIAFALCEILGSVFAFIADPIAVFVLEQDNLELFYASIWSTTFLMILFGLLLPSIAFDKTCDCLRKIDEPRKREIEKQFKNENKEEKIPLDS